jgi:hypothetical protein
MNKHKFFSVLKYACGILAASFILEFLDLSQASANFEHLLTYQFWGKLAGLFAFYLAGAYVLVYFAGKPSTEPNEE